MKQGVLRRAISIAMVLVGLFTVISGLWNFFPPFNSRFSPGHAVGACIFSILGVVHLWLNRRQLLRHFRGLGWWWCLVGLGLAGLGPLLLVPFLRM